MNILGFLRSKIDPLEAFELPDRPRRAPELLVRVELNYLVAGETTCIGDIHRNVNGVALLAEA